MKKNVFSPIVVDCVGVFMKFNNESSIVSLRWRFLGSSVVTEMFRVFEICVPCVFEFLLCPVICRIVLHTIF